MQAVLRSPVFTDALVKQKDTLLTSTSLCLRDQCEMKQYRKCTKQRPLSLGDPVVASQMVEVISHRRAIIATLQEG